LPASLLSDFADRLDLSKSYTNLNSKQKLFLLRTTPGIIFPILFKVWKPTHLVFEKDTDPYGLDRDTKITRLAEEVGIKVISKIGRTLYDPFEIVEANGGKPTMSITQLEKAAKSVASIPEPLPTLKEIPDQGDMELEKLTDMMKGIEPPKAYPDSNTSARVASVLVYDHLAGPDRDFIIPKVSDFGFPKATTPHHGGETIALKTLDEMLSNEDYTATFNKTSTAPTDFDPQSTTLMSPHLHFGTMSVRRFWYGINNAIKEYKDDGGTGTTGLPANLQGQLQF
jgi:deoxyribodipyrimidine photolyase